MEKARRGKVSWVGREGERGVVLAIDRSEAGYVVLLVGEGVEGRGRGEDADVSDVFQVGGF